MNDIIKKQLLVGSIDIIICAIPGILVYYLSNLTQLFEFLNILFIIGFVYSIYVLLTTFGGGRSPGSSLLKIILIQNRTGKSSRLYYFIREFFKILFIFYLALSDLNNLTLEDGILIFVFLSLLFPVKYQDDKVIYYSSLNNFLKIRYINIADYSE
jgi:uncharacterized RDD family membrane protein YckC